MNYDYKNLRPFKWFILQNFPFIEVDFDAITNWQLFCKLGEEINKIINSTNLTGQQVEDLTNAFNNLQNYVNNYFANLDVQDEINNKLDDMVTDGTLAEIINQQIFSELNQKINNNETKINDLSENVITYPYFDILKNEGHADGTTPNDTIFANAKNSGYRKFYFPQNENGNANYYFTNVPNFNDCEIYTDKDVVLNFPNLSGINNTKNGFYKNNINLYSRQQNRQFIQPKNESDFFNQFALPNYLYKNARVYKFNPIDPNLKLFKYNYQTGHYEDNTTNISNLYQSIGFDIRYKANAGYSIIGVPIDRTKNCCVEIVTTPNTRIEFGCVDENTGRGIYGRYLGDSNGQYWFVDGTPNQTVQVDGSITCNLFKHQGQYSNNNRYNLPMKYKLRVWKTHVQLFVNDNFVHALPLGSDATHIGFGVQHDTTPNVSSDNGFSEFLYYEEESVPLNSNLKILIAGDSRQYGYNQLYKIEDMITNGLKNNGINKVEINNISVSGWTVQQIKTAIQNTDLSQYDLVILCTGINNYNDSYQTILQNVYDICTTCKNNKCFVIIPATIPAGYGGTDSASDIRSQEYYKIQQAVMSAPEYFGASNLYMKIIPNIMGNTLIDNNIEVCNDGVHPNTQGCILFAKSIVNQILHLLD